jgi:hypothetical protein
VLFSLFFLLNFHSFINTMNSRIHHAIDLYQKCFFCARTETLCARSTRKSQLRRFDCLEFVSAQLLIRSRSLRSEFKTRRFKVLKGNLIREKRRVTGTLREERNDCIAHSITFERNVSKLFYSMNFHELTYF